MKDMIEMLKAKDIRALQQVNRSTVYRQAEAGRLPVIKLGRQWRFPADQFDNWFQAKIAATPAASNGTSVRGSAPVRQSWELAELLSWEWLEIIQDTFAGLLVVMLVVTDLEGMSINRPTHPCGFFGAISDKPGALQKSRGSSRYWGYGTVPLTQKTNSIL